MFEAIFRITAQVKSDELGQRVFRVTEREAPANDAEFLSRLATLYQQEVYTTLQPGDDLTVAVRLDLPPREVERTVHLREDRCLHDHFPDAAALAMSCVALLKAGATGWVAHLGRRGCSTACGFPSHRPLKYRSRAEQPVCGSHTAVHEDGRPRYFGFLPGFL